jgi:hypothetical protein
MTHPSYVTVAAILFTVIIYMGIDWHCLASKIALMRPILLITLITLAVITLKTLKLQP